MAKSSPSPSSTLPLSGDHKCSRCIITAARPWGSQVREASAPESAWDFWDRQIKLLVSLSWSQTLRFDGCSLFCSRDCRSSTAVRGRTFPR